MGDRQMPKISEGFLCSHTPYSPWKVFQGDASSLKQHSNWKCSWLRHQTFSALLAICVENSPHKGQWRGALMFSVICAWINGWVNNREAGDLRRHYDVIVMLMIVALTSRRWWWNIKRNTAVCDQTTKPLSWLTRCGLITPHGIIDPEQHWFLCLTQPSHYLQLLWNGHLGTNFDITPLQLD